MACIVSPSGILTRIPVDRETGEVIQPVRPIHTLPWIVGLSPASCNWEHVICVDTWIPGFQRVRNVMRAVLSIEGTGMWVELGDDRLFHVHILSAEPERFKLYQLEAAVVFGSPEEGIVVNNHPELIMA